MEDRDGRMMGYLNLRMEDKTFPILLEGEIISFPTPDWWEARHGALGKGFLCM